MLRAAREARGQKQEEVAVDAYRVLRSRRGMSREILRKIESGETPLARVDSTRLAALCHVLGLPLRQVSPDHADELESIIRTIGGDPGFSLRAKVARKPARQREQAAA